MTALSIQPTFPTFTGADGQPLENGYIWIGTANLNPITNPITVYWDAALSAPATQPIRTLGGYPSNSGTPARMYVNSDYSIQVLDRKGSVVYSAPVATERYGGGIINAADVVYDPAGTGAVATTVQEKLRERVSVKDFGAVGDGVTDDTAAIQAAIDYANSIYTNTSWGKGGATVYMKGGRYKHSGLTIKAGVNLKGDGEFNTILALTGVSTTALKSPAATSGLAADGVSVNIEGIAFVSDETTPSGQTMLNAIGFTYSTFKNVNFEWCGGVSAVTMLNSTLAGSGGPSQWYNQFYSCNFLRLASRPAGGIGLQLGDTAIGKEQVTTWTFVGGRVSGAGDGSGLQLRGTGNQFVGVTFEGMDTAVDLGSASTRGATGNSFFGCYFEGNTVNRQVRANAENTLFSGCFVTGGSDTISSSSVTFAEFSSNKWYLPTTGEWEIGVANGGTKRPAVRGTAAGFDLIAGANDATLINLSGTSQAFNFLCASALSLVYPLWEAGLSAFSPGDDNVKVLGRSSLRWNTVYAGTGTINTSDAREKQQVRVLSDAERAVAVKLKYLVRAFKFNDAVEKKGDGARVHFGVIAQDVKAAFESEGLVAERYAIICYDEWEAEPEMTAPVLDDDGNPTGEVNVVRTAKPAGNRYGVRYEELLAFIISAL